MSEFSNRIKAQRELLRIVNTKMTSEEELYGLSESAIDRWISAYRLPKESKISKLLKAASGQLYFLANKSQEQITDEYKSLIEEFRTIAEAIEVELSVMSSN
nr:hypothetical protein [uncultured Pseudodesulfovibrio sp.]